MYFGIFSAWELTFLIIFGMVVGIVLFLGRLVEKIPQDTMVSNINENGFLFKEIVSENDVNINITSSDPVIMRLVYSNSVIKEYDDSNDEVEVFCETLESKSISYWFPRKTKMRRYMFVYGRPNAYVISKFGILNNKS